jgi:hypothetical protein
MSFLALAVLGTAHAQPQDVRIYWRPACRVIVVRPAPTPLAPTPIYVAPPAALAPTGPDPALVAMLNHVLANQQLILAKLRAMPAPGAAAPAPCPGGPPIVIDPAPVAPPLVLPPGATPPLVLPPGATPPLVLPPGATPPLVLPPGATPPWMPPAATGYHRYVVYHSPTRRYYAVYVPVRRPVHGSPTR